MDTALLILIAALAGAVSVLTPCVLPLLPVILAVSTQDGRRRSWGIVIGILVSFLGISLLIGGLLDVVGLPARTLEVLAAVMLGLFAIMFLVPPVRSWTQLRMSALVARLPIRRTTGSGFTGGFAAGIPLGLVWAPCAGPILAGVTIAANTQGFTTRTVAVMLAYGLGMLVPLYLIVRGGKAMGDWLKRRLGSGRIIDVTAGLLLATLAVLVGTGNLTQVNQTIAESVRVSSTPTASLEQRVIERQSEASGNKDGERPSKSELEANGYPASEDGELHDLGPAPQIRGINRWYNTPGDDPLTPEDLEGKVVLIDVWTYSCINCIRTLPYVRRLHDRYADDGLVIIGLHAPEFAFEKDEDNVRRAIDDLEVTWPVATDPDFTTWNAFHNRFWPAKYLIDRDGDIRYVHYGEGEYATTEARVQELLGMEPTPEAAVSEDSAQRQQRYPQTPETYIGYERAAGDQWQSVPAGSDGPDLVADRGASYRAAPKQLDPSEFALSGRWTVRGEHAEAGADAELDIAYQAQDVFLVVAPPAGSTTAALTVTDRGEPGAEPRRIALDTKRLYDLRRGDEQVSSRMRIEVPAGAQVYAFTFG